MSLTIPFKTIRDDGHLTVGELEEIEARIDEIDTIADLCDADRDSDVLHNLDMELDYWCDILELSLKVTREKEAV